MGAIMTDGFTAIAKSSVTVSGRGGFGSGTVIESNDKWARILTCNHVIANVERLKITYARGSKLVGVTCKVELSDEDSDLAIMRTARPISPPAIAIAHDEPELFDSVMILGTANGMRWTASIGMLTAKDNSNFANDGLYQYSGLAVDGLSGGTMANDASELVGVPSCVARNGHLYVWNMGFAVPLPAIKKLIKRL
jgi:serine protease Do